MLGKTLLLKAKLEEACTLPLPPKNCSLLFYFELSHYLRELNFIYFNIFLPYLFFGSFEWVRRALTPTFGWLWWGCWGRVNVWPRFACLPAGRLHTKFTLNIFKLISIVTHNLKYSTISKFGVGIQIFVHINFFLFFTTVLPLHYYCITIVLLFFMLTFYSFLFIIYLINTQ